MHWCRFRRCSKPNLKKRLNILQDVVLSQKNVGHSRMFSSASPNREDVFWSYSVLLLKWSAFFPDSKFSWSRDKLFRLFLSLYRAPKVKVFPLPRAGSFSGFFSMCPAHSQSVFYLCMYIVSVWQRTWSFLYESWGHLPTNIAQQWGGPCHMKAFGM